MTEPLKNHFGPAIPQQIAAMVAAVHPPFNTRAFLRDALDGYLALELMPRGRHIARALHRHLPSDYPRAIKILLDSLAVPYAKPTYEAMAAFFFLPHVSFVAEFGLDHFEESMRAQHVLTQRFTAEFSIRPFLERHTERTLARLREWTTDPSEQVRRLVSEGTRPRLPWASRLRAFQQDPRPVLALLELLKDDPALYVRRSVANNLNDIGKDHPALLVSTARRWMKDAEEERRWVIRHALRSAVKQGDPAALAVLGFGAKVSLSINAVKITPARARLGGKVLIAFDVVNRSIKRARVLVDFRIHYVKAGGHTSAKVFKLKELELAPGESASLAKTVSLAEMTTRKHHAGRHRVEVLLNGEAQPLGYFQLLP
jgi:3-methyladenine DNA glycosylase AlkC